MVVSIVNVTPNHGSRYYTQEGNRTDKEQQQASNWCGKLTEVLGIKGEVTSDALAHLLHGCTPTDEPLLNKSRLHGWQQNARSQGKEVPLERAGIDLTTSAPKSISIQALVFGDSRLEEAHRQATGQMLSFLEDRYALTRLTKDKQRQKILTGQLAIAQFHHESSRALDPQLHTHNLILNLQQRPDGRWQSLDNEAIYRAKMLLGKIYRNELALRIQALGYGIQVIHSRHGLWELDGFSSSQMGQFSKRAQQIEAIAGENASSRKKAWITFTSGRQEKQSVPWSVLVERWRQEALRSEIQPIQTGEAVQPTSLMAQTAVQAAIDQMLKPVFRREEIEHLALLPPGQASITEIDAAIDYHPSLILCSNTQGQRQYTKGVHDVLSRNARESQVPTPNLAETALSHSSNQSSQSTDSTYNPNALIRFRDKLRATASSYQHRTAGGHLAGLEIGATQLGDSIPDRGIESLGQTDTQSDVFATAETRRPEPKTGSDGRSLDDLVAGDRSIHGNYATEQIETFTTESGAIAADDDWELERSRH
ncbi:MobF family relaxase [Leptolyngbyaceae cyanobacterium UHCC 1019]